MILRVARPDPAALVTQPANHLALAPLLDAEDCAGDVSVTWVRIDGRHRRLRTPASTRVYAVLTGTLAVECQGTTAVLGAGEVAAVPRGVAYALEGTAIYLVVNAPAFRAGDDEYLEP